MIQQFYQKLSDKEKKIFYFAAGAVVLALFDLLFLGPVTSRLKDINQEIVEKENSLKRDMRLLAYRNRILAERETFRPYYNTEVLTPDQVKASFLQKIEMLATEAKVNLTKVAPSGEEKQKGFVKYLADLECTGTLEDIVKFMHLVDSTQELLKITKVNIISKPSAKEVSATMTVVRIIFDPRAVWTEKELAQKQKPTNQRRSGSGSGAGGNSSGDSDGANTGAAGEGAGGEDAGTGGQVGGASGGSGGAGVSGAGSSPADKGGTGGQRTSGSESGNDISVGKDIPTRQVNQQAGAPQRELTEEELAAQAAEAEKEAKGDGRVKVTNIMDLWHNFWGYEAPEPKPGDIDYEELEKEASKPEKPNLWQKLRGQGEPPQE